MRIVAGKHRGRQIAAPEDGSVRPTSDRVREALFNIVAHGRPGVELVGARVLDAFCGSGALGLEALSRGAAHACFIDKDLSAIECLRRNVNALGVGADVTVRQSDLMRPPPAVEPSAIAFLDPPYGSALAAPALAALADAGWLAPGALAVVELNAREPFSPPAGLAVADERTYGRTRLVFLHREA